jgi:hypothetical protein
MVLKSSTYTNESKTIKDSYLVAVRNKEENSKITSEGFA